MRLIKKLIGDKPLRKFFELVHFPELSIFSKLISGKIPY